uniref:Uncharacterized protein n=1 Tax=Megaselia scalaris TaxID=36166 RepID=T1H0B4_MEGSC
MPNINLTTLRLPVNNIHEDSVRTAMSGSRYHVELNVERPLLLEYPDHWLFSSPRIAHKKFLRVVSPTEKKEYSQFFCIGHM